ncbi:hypothetical protein M405DRAFT_880808 [Rhizopogon salebrosus TDB-379]|nr:hypothetical protein M405DRAFT_880808 [Rhizopogon salebrosus TDB-379]
MASLAFLILFSIIPCILAVQVHPVARAVTSEANCSATGSDYDWTFDTQGQSPCLIAAYVEASCIGSTYDQPVLKVGYSYALPNSSTSNQCYCSWSSYNLLMACTLCQGANFSSSVWPWTTWSTSCTNSSWTDVYFPSGYQLSGNASIPYWATTNPANWMNGLFNMPQAQAAYQQNSSDVTPAPSPSSPSSTSNSSSSKSTDLGAIVGGTVGGAAALALIAVGAYLLYRRHAFNKGAYAAVFNRRGTGIIDRTNDASTTMTHSRFPSDTSTQFAPGYSAYSPQPQMMYPSFQGSFSPPPRTDTSVYTTRGGQPSSAIPLV